MSGAGPLRLQRLRRAATSPAEAGEETEWGAGAEAEEETEWAPELKRGKKRGGAPGLKWGMKLGGLAAWWWGEVEAVGAGLRGACDDGFVDGLADWREADEA